MGARYVSCIKYVVKNVCLLPVWSPVATIYLLGWRSFSRYNKMYQASPCHIRLCVSSPLTHSIPSLDNCLLLCGFYSRLRCHRSTCVRLIRPPPDYWYTSFFALAGPGSLHENGVSAFSRDPTSKAILTTSDASSTTLGSIPIPGICKLRLAVQIHFHSYFLR